MFSTLGVKKTWLWTLGAGLLLLGLLAFTEVRHNQKRCQAIIVRIKELDGHRFLSQRDVKRYLTRDGTDPIVGDLFTDIDLRELEKRLAQYGLISKCQLSRDLSGNLIVDIEQPRPLARLITSGNGLRTASGRYISEEGRFFALSMNYSARVPLVTGGYFENRRSLSTEKTQPLLNLLRFIHADPFWRAQVAELEVDRNGEVILFPQVGEHQIEIGEPTDVETKFKKLKVFYKHVLPLNGAQAYKRVSVQYRNQIVCE
ncbi:hypothetical protein GCM10023189_52860 [Nibrella saemangeumensis]|uniref:Cell division protein FtsQ n=1 Tax=Nibrella saemangeumensis TaxID=1084526 RepID=A0ABP8NN58_9BACT